MSFSDLKGATTIRYSKEAFGPIRDHINQEFQSETHELDDVRIGDIALAVGIVEDEKAEVSGPHGTQNLGSFDNHDVMKVLIEERHPDADADELRVFFQRYLEGGAQVIANDIEETGVFRYHQYLPE